MPRRHLIAPCGGVTLDRALPPVRPPTSADRDALARVMLDAYRGTIDYDDETIMEAVAEVDAWFASPEPLVDRSRVALEAGEIVGAALLSRVDGMPFVAYLYTDPAWKRHGIGEGLIRVVMAALADAGEDRIHLWVTAGNATAERIYERLGFVDAPTDITSGP